MLTKRSTMRRSSRLEGGDELLSTEKLLDWLYYNTEWAGDFDQEKHARTLLRIWEAEQVPGQQWIITCKRRRWSGGIGRIHKNDIAKLDRFPAVHALETLVLNMEYGGGDYSLTNTKGRKHTQRITIEGPPEDPTVVQETPSPEATSEDQQNRFETELLDMAIKCLKENPVLEREVALQYLAKKLGIKIRLPDRNAPVPYSDLPDELQAWLDEHPGEKDAYMRKLLDIEEPEVEPTLEERVVERVKDKVVEHAVSSFGNRPSGWEDPVREFLGRNSLTDIIEGVLNLRAKTGSATDHQNMSDTGDSQAEGTVNQAPTTGFVPTGFRFN